MNKFTMLSPTQEDLRFIAKHLRVSDLEELRALGVELSVSQALEQCVKLSALCWVMLHQGEPVAVTGVIPVEYGVPPPIPQESGMERCRRQRPEGEGLDGPSFPPQGLRPLGDGHSLPGKIFSEASAENPAASFKALPRMLRRLRNGKIPPTRAERQAGGCLGVHPYQSLSLSPLSPHSEGGGGAGCFGEADAVGCADGGTIVSTDAGATYTNSAGAPWLVGTDKIARSPARFMRSSHWAIAEYLKNFSYLHNIVDARQTKSLRYLKALGFTLDPPRPFGNGTFHKFYLETK